MIARLRQPAGASLLVATIGLMISLYLTWTKLAGVAPICGPSGGCESVEASPYSTMGPIPVAMLGAGFSAVLIGSAVAWSRGDRRALYVAYALGLMGSLVELYLVYLELFVIHAVCLWCIGYGITVFGGWLITIWALRGPPGVGVGTRR